MSSVAFIPARSGSKRVKDKNIRLLGNHPLLSYSVCAAIDSGVFESVICATDDEKYADIARSYGAEVPFLRPVEISGDKSSDIEWLKFMFEGLKRLGREYDVFSILRPTSPFRLSTTIKRAFNQFKSRSSIDSLRAVEKCGQHPGKMWTISGSTMTPILPFQTDGVPWHSRQYAALPEIYIQNASLEIAWSRVVTEDNSISGSVVAPFLTEGSEGLDVNEEYDWWHAEHLISSGMALLPGVRRV